MSTLRNPVGPQSSKVYWRRRLLVGLGALAVIVIIVLIVSRPGSGATGKNPVNMPTTSVTPSVAAAAGKASDACAPANITLEAVTDQTSYAAGVNPKIAMKITNTGAGSCTINLGSTQQELIITSGTETIWDSKDCQTAAVDTPTVMTAGQSLTTPSIPWDRTRSSTTTCATSRPAVTAGGASYHLSVKLGSITSKATAQFLLN
ncbi:MAG: hypothetical protein QOG18_2750 [Microbacteriaceae bacterium]|jgi:hypothetical protein|nr:hypothetical protein [Microbacteriaceae bacterium]MDQ1528137.1 hypothetical protein [Microbacteriaceae bacterium]